MDNYSAYGLWPAVIVNSFVFIFFAFSFTRSNTTRDWRSLGAFSAFIVALFSEMYGFPLTIYLLSGWLGSRYPGVDLFSHESGHIWYTLFGLQGDPHSDPIHLLSNIFIFTGMAMVFFAWRVLYKAQQEHTLAKTGLYRYMRHPQYTAFILVMFGFLVQWPTLLTMLMFPVLVWVYTRLALREERQVIQEFGEEYTNYAKVTPAFIPRPANINSADKNVNRI
ncbi:MAG TPA: isoprenylcysteine carboxyl methyltransferase [Pelotomaculum sp.]|nr:isoprenylcysteine carboxyl methyltransferase [Pelotomaculum sp.]